MRERLLLCTDMDRTLLPNGNELETPDARTRFSDFCQLSKATLVYVTGRHQALVKEAIAEYQLPQPDYVIADVGSKLYQIEARNWQEMPEWLTEMNQAWQGFNNESLQPLLTQFDQLELQEPSKQNSHKLSYYTPITANKTPLLAQIKNTLSQNQIDANLIWSIDEALNIGLLDILPPNATKRHAIEHLQNQLGVTNSQTLFAGDSGNDLAVLSSPIPSVLVNNASPEVRDEAIQNATQAGNTQKLYLARSTQTDNGNYAAGILQGIWHFYPNLRPLLQDIGVKYDPKL